MSARRNLTRTSSHVSSEERGGLLGQRGVVIWLTGLSGSGKSTLAYALERRLVDVGQLAFVLDGDNLRHGLNKDLGFSPDERTENIRRVGEVAALFAEAGLISISAFISPYRDDRATARSVAGTGRFVEVHLDVPVEVCERRDPKGLYKRARAGEIPQFTGVSAPYEIPELPEISLDTDALDVDQCIDTVVAYLSEHGFLR